MDFDADPDLLAHGFNLRPGWWQRPTVPASWTSWLTDLPVSERGRGYHRIERLDLLTRNQDRTSDGCGRLLVGCYAWGTGSEAFLVGRRARVFRDTLQNVLGSRLQAARHLLDTDGPAAAYTALHDGGPLRTKHMRASFFTKFLYAADATGDGSCGRALILDQFVAIALNDLHDWGLPETGGWSADTYQRWLDHAHALAQQYALPDGTLTRPDSVEKAYFQHGRSLWRSRRPRRRHQSL